MPTRAHPEPDLDFKEPLESTRKIEPVLDFMEMTQDMQDMKQSISVLIKAFNRQHLNTLFMHSESHTF